MTFRVLEPMRAVQAHKHINGIADVFGVLIIEYCKCLPGEELFLSRLFSLTSNRA